MKWEGHSAGVEDSVVYRHWYRVIGADYLREARELYNEERFDDANDILCRGIEALQTSRYVSVPLVKSVLEDLIAARVTVRSWQPKSEVDDYKYITWLPPELRLSPYNKPPSSP